MGQSDPIQFSNRNDGPDSIWSAHYGALLAVAVKYGVPGRRIFIYDMDGRKNLQNRNSPLWEKANLEDDVEVGV